MENKNITEEDNINNYIGKIFIYGNSIIKIIGKNNFNEVLCKIILHYNSTKNIQDYWDKCTCGEVVHFIKIGNDFKIPTQEDIIWLEYCETLGVYRSKEEALDNYYVKEFVEQYLTEK